MRGWAAWRGIVAPLQRAVKGSSHVDVQAVHALGRFDVVAGRIWNAGNGGVAPPQPSEQPWHTHVATLTPPQRGSDTALDALLSK